MRILSATRLVPVVCETFITGTSLSSCTLTVWNAQCDHLGDECEDDCQCTCPNCDDDYGEGEEEELEGAEKVRYLASTFEHSQLVVDE